MKREKLLLILLACSIVLFVQVDNPLKGYVMSKLTRGYRNKNAGNLRDFGIKWQGLIGSDSDGFCIFDTVENGARAASKDVKGDIERKGQNTVRKLIESYAPPSENNTEAYISVVSKALGISDSSPLNWSLHKIPLMLAIFKHENGYILDAEKLEKGIMLA